MNRCRKCGKVGCETYYTNSRIFGRVLMSECCKAVADRIEGMYQGIKQDGKDLTVEDNINSVDVMCQLGAALDAINQLLLAKPGLELRLWNGTYRVWLHDYDGQDEGEGRLSSAGDATCEPTVATLREALRDLGAL